MSAPLSPGFMVLQGNQLEELRTLAVQWLTDNPLRPLEDECILVQSNGIAQWLKLALASNAQGNGIAAAVNVQLPGRFIWQAYRSVFDELPTSSPYDKTPLTWRLYRLLGDIELLNTALGQNTPLQGFLTADSDPRRCYQLAGKLADLYDQYQLYRADWLEAWEQGSDIIIKPNGSQQFLPAEQQWQAQLWRLVSQRIQQEASDSGRWSKASRAQIHQAFMQECKKFSPQQRPTGLPRRVIVFSISSLPRQTLELLQAISPFTQVMIFASNPSQHYWGDLIEGKELLKREYRRIAERKIPANIQPEQLHAYGHPLLASWGKQGRDFLHLLDEHDQPDQYNQLFASQKIDLFSEPEGNGLLQQLQSDILNLRTLEESRELHPPIDPAQDSSLQFLLAHSPQREVEILHDQLLASFETAKANGQPLNPRDILVMVPDINQYAPHIHAVFGHHAERSDGQYDPRHLPFHISDQSQRQHNTLLIALEKLLQLPRSRFAVSELSDLLDTPALRQRFGIDEADLPSLRRWIQGANIRWGLDEQQRCDLGLPAIKQNTWLFGLERMLLGFATGNNTSWQGIEAYDEVAGLEAALLGPLAQLVQSLQHSRQQLQQDHNTEQWLEVLRQLIADFFTDDHNSPADSWALGQLELQLERLQGIWQDAGLGDMQLPLEVVRQELLTGLDETSLTQKFLGGSINFATLMPMRAIPFRQLWLLGMNDKDYPRSTHSADFDLMASDYRPGDRSRREDDRYLFLEALLSARERLVISWVGRDIRDNSTKPPSVLVSQLRDHIQSGWTLAGAETQGNKEALLAALTSEHPLQPFSRSYFEVERDPRLFTYQQEWRNLHDNPPAQADDPASLTAWQPQAAVTLAVLGSFLRNPVQYFYRQRLGIQWFDSHAEIADTEPFTPDQLEAWQLRQQLIEQVCKHLHTEDNAQAEQLLQQELERQQRSGVLPVPPFSKLVQTELEQALLEPLQQYQQLLTEYPVVLPAQAYSLQLQPVQLELHDRLGDIRQNANGQLLRLLVQPSVLHSGNSKKYHHLIRHWPAHLLAQLKQPVTTRLLGPNTDLSLPPIAASKAEALLLELLQGLYQGMQKPLPLPCKTAFAMLENGKSQEAYEGGQYSNGEVNETPGLQKYWPDYASLKQDPDFTEYAESLYRPLLEVLKQDEDEDEEADAG